MNGCRWILLGILLVAAGTRLIGLESAPPGIHHDEASNGYDAYALLKTGQDRWGHDWPVLLEGFGRGDHRGALYAYLCIPFHVLAGAEHLIWSTRAPAAVLGVLTILALYSMVSRVEGQAAGLVAATLLTVSPWHLHLSRIGHESTLVPATIVIAMWCWSRWRQHWAYVVTAGAVTGLSLYGYSTMRLITPMLLAAGLLCFHRDVLGWLKDRRGRWAVVGGLALMVVILLPLAMRMIDDGEAFMSRTREVSVLHHPTWSIGEKIQRVATQYIAHFSPNWLVLRGDPYPLQSIRGVGQLNWIALPLLIVGIAVSLWHCRRNRSYRFLILWLLLYPLPGAITHGGLDSPGVGGVHALRSACGLGMFQWLAAIGATWLTSAMTRHRDNPKRYCTAMVVVGLAIVINGGYCVRQYFGVWSRDAWIKSLYQDDLVDALRTIRPHWQRFDHIYISVQTDAEKRWYSGEPYSLALLTLPVEPDAFHNWDKEVDYVRPTDGFHRVRTFGPFIASTETSDMQASFTADPDQAAMIIARPNESFPPQLPRIAEIRDASGAVRFVIIANRDVR